MCAGPRSAWEEPRLELEGRRIVEEVGEHGLRPPPVVAEHRADPAEEPARERLVPFPPPAVVGRHAEVAGRLHREGMQRRQEPAEPTADGRTRGVDALAASFR